MSFENIQTKNIDLQTFNKHCNPDIFNYPITKEDTDTNILSTDITPSRKNQYIKNHHKTLAHFIPTYAYTSNKDIEYRDTCTLPDHMLNLYQNMTGQTCSTGTGAILSNGYSNNEIQKGCVLPLNYSTEDMRTIINKLQQSLDNANILKLQALNVEIENYKNKIPLEKKAADAQEVLRNEAIKKYNIRSNTCSNVKYSIPLSNQVVIDMDIFYNNNYYIIETENTRRRYELMNMYYESNLDLLVRNRNALSFIKVFEHIGYQGMSAKIPLNTYFDRNNVFYNNNYASHISWIENYFTNDRISSIRIPRGISTVCFQHINFNGWNVTFNDSVENLFWHAMNDNISSLIIRGGFKSSVDIDTPNNMYAKINTYY